MLVFWLVGLFGVMGVMGVMDLSGLMGVMGVMGMMGMILSKSTKKEIVPYSIKKRPFHSKVKEGVSFCESLEQK